MGAVLQVIGALVLIVILLVAIGMFALWWKVRSMMKGAKNLMETMGSSVMKVEVQLNIVNEIPWNDSKFARASTEQLLSLGFLPDGEYALDGMKGAYVKGFVHQDGRTSASISQLGDISCWVDFFADTDEGLAITATNLDKKIETMNPEYRTVILRPGADLPSLHSEVVTTLAKLDGEVNLYQQGDFKTHFESGYRKAASWRFRSSERVTEQQIIFGKSLGYGIDPATEAFLLENGLMNSDSLQESLRDRYLSESGISALDWERIEDQVFFVTEEMYSESVRNLLATYELVDQNEMNSAAERMKEKRGTELFWALCMTLGIQSSFEKIYELSEPVKTEVILFKTGGSRSD